MKKIILVIFAAAFTAGISAREANTIDSDMRQESLLLMIMQLPEDINLENMDYSTKIKALFIAIEANLPAMVERLLALKADSNAKNEYGQTPLQFAIYYGNIKILKALIAKGPNVNTQDNQGYTPLHTAAAYGNLDVANALISAGANIEAINNHGNTPLHEAVINNHIKIVQLLLAAEANVDAQAKSGNTPLHEAILKSPISIISLLLDAGASINVINTLDFSPYTYAFLFRSNGIRRLLLRQPTAKCSLL